ncbi:P-loop NTPase family protein [Aeoliella mucimassa]|nr:CpsD/CapB family tyrosine-protein kinase [Aeoliella mucimassa]
MPTPLTHDPSNGAPDAAGDDAFEQFNPATHRPRQRRRTSDEYDSVLWRMRSQLSSLDGVAEILGVVGAEVGVGATTVAMNLANRLADHLDGNVLLVDSNFSRPQADAFLGIKRCPGLAEMLAENLPLAEVVQRTRVPGLEVLAAGRVGILESVAIHSEAVAIVVQQMREEYAGVVFDFSDPSSMGQGLLLAKQCDGVLLVAQCERTRQESARRAAEQLRVDGVRLTGAVLNRQRSYVPKWIRRWL